MNLSHSNLNFSGKSFYWSLINGPENLQKENISYLNLIKVKQYYRELSLQLKYILKRRGYFHYPTWTCQLSWSLETHILGSSSGTTVIESFVEPDNVLCFDSFKLGREGLSIHEIRSIFIKASSWKWEPLLKHSLSVRSVAFFHLCSKFIRTSYAAGPSILECKSCHGCLGALVPA